MCSISLAKKLSKPESCVIMSLYSASIWRTIRCAVHMFHIALTSKVHS